MTQVPALTCQTPPMRKRTEGETERVGTGENVKGEIQILALTQAMWGPLIAQVHCQ